MSCLVRLATVPPSLPVGFRSVGGGNVGYSMSCISYARTSNVDAKENRIDLDTPLVSAAGVRNIIQVFAVVLGAASLAACAQSSVVSNRSGLVSSRQAGLENDRKIR